MVEEQKLAERKRYEQANKSKNQKIKYGKLKMERAPRP